LTKEFTDIDYERFLKFVKETLDTTHSNISRRHPFRDRNSHIRRVMSWAERISEGIPDVDMQVLLTACAFHDAGYNHDDESVKHEITSAAIFRQYGEEHGFSQDFIDKVAGCIAIHSEKYLLKEPENLSIEQILLMEADMLDEEGALAVCWDGMAAGHEGLTSYAEAYEKTRKGLPKLDVQPMVTPHAKRIWSEKQEFLHRYVELLGDDLKEWRAL